MKKIFLDVGELRKRAAERYLSAVELAKETGVSYQRLCELYRRDTAPIRETSLMKLARALECRPSDIVVK